MSFIDEQKGKNEPLKLESFMNEIYKFYFYSIIKIKECVHIMPKSKPSSFIHVKKILCYNYKKRIIFLLLKEISHVFLKMPLKNIE